MYKRYLLQILSCTGRTLQIGTPQPEQYWKQSDLSLHPAENNRKLNNGYFYDYFKNYNSQYQSKRSLPLVLTQTPGIFV